MPASEDGWARMGLLAERAEDRERMIQRQLFARGVRDPRVLAAFRAVPRELFVGEGRARAAYDDAALPIEAGQTISQPYVVGVMIAALHVQPTDRVLEVGAGSGYATAVLAQLAAQICAIEWHPALATQAAARLDRLGIRGAQMRVGDGTLGWPGEDRFDAILVSAGGPSVPQPLIEQLAPGGRLVIPVGSRDSQELLLLTRSADGTEMHREQLGPVVFVPLLSSTPG